MKIPFDKKWTFLEKEDYVNYLFVVHAWEGYTILPANWGFINERYLGTEYIDKQANLFVERSHNEKAKKKMFSWLFTDPNKWDYLHKVTKSNSSDLIKFSKQAKKINAKKLSDKQLINWLEEFNKMQASVHVPGGPMFMLETPDNLVSKYLIGYLEEKHQDYKPVINPSDAFQILTTPHQKSNWTKEQIELAEIGKEKNKKLKSILLGNHARKYEWLEYGLQGKILGLDHFEKNLKEIEKTGAENYLNKIENDLKNTIKKQKKIIKDYHIHPSHQKVLKIVQDSFYTRLYSKDAQFYGFYCFEHLFKELGRRCFLSLEQVKYLAPHEYRQALMGKKDMTNLTNNRMQYSLHISDKGKTKYYVGKGARQVRRKIKYYREKSNKSDSNIIKGQPAYKGKARGIVKIINTMPEMAKMHQENILVSHMTNPSIVPAMKMAAGIITDIGGITCHAAIVSRELKVPCIIGTKVATDLLRDGDRVEVDADKGIVRKI